MKKAFKIISFSILLVTLLSVISYASGITSYTFYYDNREITIEGYSISEEKAHAIADYIVFGIMPAGSIEPENTTNSSLLCILFGHSIETYSALETIHNVYTTSPKCVENTYLIEYCTRSSCDYFESTLTYTHRIATCHG